MSKCKFLTKHDDQRSQHHLSGLLQETERWRTDRLSADCFSIRQITWFLLFISNLLRGQDFSSFYLYSMYKTYFALISDHFLFPTQQCWPHFLKSLANFLHSFFVRLFSLSLSLSLCLSLPLYSLVSLTLSTNCLFLSHFSVTF